MKRTATIRVNGKSGLDLEVKITYRGSKRDLVRDEQESVFQTAINHIHAAVLEGVPYHRVNASDVTIR